VFTANYGERPDVPNIVVLLVDGTSASYATTTAAAENCKNDGIQIFAVGKCAFKLYLNIICSKISHETLLNTCSVIHDFLLPLMVGQSHDSFKLLSVKDVILFQHCQQVIQGCARGTDRRHSEANMGGK
jgi:hypothetical protein